jgi:hypothetical protein
MTGIGFRLRRLPEKVDLIAEKSLAAQTREASFCQQHLPAVRRCLPRSTAVAFLTFDLLDSRSRAMVA